MPSAGVVNTAKTCGSGLARDGVGTFSLSLPDIPLSLASQLPQGFMLINSLVHTAEPVGYRLKARARNGAVRLFLLVATFCGVPATTIRPP